ncbi:MAG TPA: hypothetical protein VI776_09400, partial [Anaerolineales bacterium]|nr:hypothetical protein [Anaerolineales bacterium]
SKARLASPEQRWDVALEKYAQLSETLEARGLRLWLAQLLREWAEVYLTRGEPGDSQQARQLLERALALYEEMEIPYYAGIVRDRMREIEA